MADTIRIRRRTSGAPGSPGTLANAELAYNEVDHTLYYGEGTGGAGGTASVVVPVGGSGLGSSALPAMNGTAAAGVATTMSRGDHVHPTDTSRAALVSPVFSGNPTCPTPTIGDADLSIANTAFVQGTIDFLMPSGATVAPLMDGTATIGISTKYARQDHIHPSDTSRAPLNSPAFTGTPTTAASPGNGDNTLKLATTAYVIATRLDQFQPPNADVPWNSRRITGLLNPSAAQDAATKSYVDATAQGIDAKQSCVVASTGNVTLSGAQTVDGFSVNSGDRVLLKNQTAPAENGIWIGNTIGAWSRATDADTWVELMSAFTFVEQGPTNADSGWLCTVDAGTLGTTPVTWVQFSGAGQVSAGAGLTKTGSVLDVVGTTNRITVLADNIDIASTYVGQGSITTLGTVASGAWNASVIGVSYGGTGAATLTGYVKGNGASAMTASATIPLGDVAGLGTMAAQNATAVAITGGTIDGVVLDGGTF